jgi:tetratricopeptide (TPR) repeat protein
MISEIHLQLGRFDLAELYGQRALEFAQKLKNADLIYLGYLRLGNVALTRGNDQEAEKYFRRVAVPQALPADQGFLGLGRVYDNRRQFERALGYYEQAIWHHEAVRQARIMEEDRSNIFRRGMEASERALDTLLKLHFRNEASREYARRAFQASERIRNRLSADQLSASWNRVEGRTGFEAQLRRVEEDLSEVSNKLLNKSFPADQQRQLESRFERLEIEKAVIRRSIAYYSKVDASSGGMQENSIEHIQEILPDSVAFLEYSVVSLP